MRVLLWPPFAGQRGGADERINVACLSHLVSAGGVRTTHVQVMEVGEI